MPSNNSTVGDVVCSTETKKAGWRWEPHHQETRRPGEFSKLSSSGMEQFGDALTLVYLKFGLCQSGCCGFMERGTGGTGSSSGSFAGTSSPASLSPLLSNLGTGAVQAPWVCHQPSSQKPEGHMRNIYFSVFFSFLNFIYVFILALLDLHSCTGLSHVEENGGHVLVRVPRLLTAVASLVEGHRL